MKRKKIPKKLIFELVYIGMGAILIGSAGSVLWISTWRLPDLNSSESRKVTQSTKIYDRTGEVLLFDVHEDVKRTVVPYEEISRYLKNATVAIEDSEFYEHHGIKPRSILRAILVNLGTFEFSQGGSTITQQVIKNAFLTKEKTISRKLKEWVLAMKIEKELTKDQILGMYLNEAPYGGNLYGAEEASQAYFSKPSKDLELAEAAYLAALPQAPTYYSPYGNHINKLIERKNLVLKKMLEQNFITEEEYQKAHEMEVRFNKAEERGIKAPHFVIYVREYLVEKYGEEVVEEQGLKVITTLDYKLQKEAERIVQSFALENAQKYKASNAGLVALDPKTGHILALVGSRDYFDEEIDGNYNVALAHRQPGSSFKPFAYATAFIKGFLPETTILDVETEFSSACHPDGAPRTPSDVCYSPVNYDNIFRGPISFRNALAQSVNIPAVKVLYLAGLKDTLTLARDMGITTLEGANRYGLTLVLGGGEVTLLDMTSAYGTFGNSGARNPPVAILSVETNSGEKREEFIKKETQVIPEEIALTISDVLSDETAREPAFGVGSPLSLPGVAVKTGTTNNYRDAWILGYTPTLAVGAWAGNNDNTPMEKKVAGFIVAPLWNAFMKEALTQVLPEEFKKPTRQDLHSINPVVRGNWQGGQTYVVDKITGKRATAATPEETREERSVREIHTILHWIDKENPHGLAPTDPKRDPQYENWEYAVRKWALTHGLTDEDPAVIPKEEDTVHGPQFAPSVIITEPRAEAIFKPNSRIVAALTATGKFPLQSAEFYLNNSYLGAAATQPFSFSFVPGELAVTGENILTAVVKDAYYNRTEVRVTFQIEE